MGESSRVRRHCPQESVGEGIDTGTDGVMQDLVSYIRTSFADVATHLTHDPDMFIAVQQRILFIFSTCTAPMSSFICLETCVGENNNKPLGVFVGGRNRDVLFGDESWKFRCWEGLGPLTGQQWLRQHLDCGIEA